MPLHFGKIGAAIALLTVAATEEADQTLEPSGALELGGSSSAS
jgi:hypothetical protein